MAFAKPRETPQSRRKKREELRLKKLEMRKAAAKERMERMEKNMKHVEHRSQHDWLLWEEKAGVCVEASFINTGYCTVPESFTKEGGSEENMFDIPVLCCLLRHPQHGLIMVDTGMPEGVEDGLPEASLSTRTMVKTFNARLSKNGSAATQIDKCNAKDISLEDVKTVIYTHYHYDHTGDIERYPNAQIVVGDGCMDVVTKSLKGFKGVVKQGWPEDLERVEEVKFTDELWVGSFRYTYDLFGDASVILVECKGHTAGNLSVLVRTRKGMILLAGDTAYCLDNFEGCVCAKGILPKVHKYMPKWARTWLRPDELPNEALECLRKLNRLKEEHPDIFIVPAHDRVVFDLLKHNKWMFPNFIK